MTRNFKSIIAAVMVLCLAISLIACTSEETPEATAEPTAETTTAPTAEPTAEPTDEPTATPESTDASTEEPTATSDPTTPEPTAIPEGYPVPDIFSANFTADGMTDTSGNDYTIVKFGEPTTKYSEDLGRYVMVCNGGTQSEGDGSCFNVFGYDKYYDEMLTSFTWEFYAMYYEAYQEMYVMSNLHAGGFAMGVPEGGSVGLEDQTSYMLLMRDNVSGSYDEIKFCDGEENVWTHCVATWDGTTIKLYVNGEFVASDVIGEFAWTTAEAAQYLAIGCDTATQQDGEYFWYGEIARCNIYSQCLTDEQVAQIYAAAIAK